MRSSAVALAFVSLLVTMSFAGCVEETPPTTNEATTTAVPAAPPAVNDTAGSITGRVTDDELVPIASATISVLQNAQEAKTDAEGKFTLNGLETGKYSLVITRVGYTELAKNVEVQSGAVTDVQFVLTPIVIENPYHVTVTKIAQIHAGWLYLTYVPWGLGVNNSAYNALLCDPCRFTLSFEPGPVGVKEEYNFKAGVMNAAVNNQVYVSYSKNATDGYGTQVSVHYAKHRSTVSWSAAQLKHVEKVNAIDLWINPDLAGINHEMRAEAYTTFAYYGPLPDDFTALPPP